MSNAELNILYYSVGLVYMLLLLRRFLRRSFDAALDAKGRFVLSIVGGYAADLALSFILSSLLLIFGLDLGNSPNNVAITSELSTDYGRIAVLSIALAPIVEEPLFRGLIFGGIRPKEPRAGVHRLRRALLALPRLAVRRPDRATSRCSSTACCTCPSPSASPGPMTAAAASGRPW